MTIVIIASTYCEENEDDEEEETLDEEEKEILCKSCFEKRLWQIEGSVHQM